MKLTHDRQIMKIYNGIIKLDDLYWNEEDGKFTPLNDVEYEKIIIECINSNIRNRKDVENVVRWAEQIRCGDLLLRGLLSGRLLVEMKDGEPGFAEKEV